MEVARVLADRELSFTGPVDAQVLEACMGRLHRMRLLQERAARERLALDEQFRQCLGSETHTTECRVHLWSHGGTEWVASGLPQLSVRGERFNIHSV